MKAKIINWGFSGQNRDEYQRDPISFRIQSAMSVYDVKQAIKNSPVFRILESEVIDALLDSFFVIAVSRLSYTDSVANAVGNDKGSNGDLCVNVKVTYP
jgi:hypothetical protein